MKRSLLILGMVGLSSVGVSQTDKDIRNGVAEEVVKAHPNKSINIVYDVIANTTDLTEAQRLDVIQRIRQALKAPRVAAIKSAIPDPETLIEEIAKQLARVQQDDAGGDRKPLHRHIRQLIALDDAVDLSMSLAAFVEYEPTPRPTMTFIPTPTPTPSGSGDE